jgi:hypothetical protein
MKWETIKSLNIATHYDNNQKEIDLINRNTDAKGVNFNLNNQFFSNGRE